jgi:thiamine-monophosphate kinase
LVSWRLIELFPNFVVTEFELIERYFSPPTTHTVLAGGDDAALLAVTPGMELVVTTDMLLGGRHFLEDADAEGVGWKSLAVNLSDIAAMGAHPRWATLAIALPSADQSWIAAFMRGFLDLARQHEVDLIGGDTTRGPLSICVQVLGEAPASRALRRSGARAGDELWVSGTVGDAALALAHLRGEFELHATDLAYARRRLDRPCARVALGEGLRGLATSAIDVSDGLVADAGHIAERSGVRLVIRWPQIPVSSVAQHYRDDPLVQRCVLAGGDDYELCFTAAPAHRDEVIELGARLGLPLTPIGSVEPGSGVAVVDAAGRPLALTERGFDHFG